MTQNRPKEDSAKHLRGTVSRRQEGLQMLKKKTTSPVNIQTRDCQIPAQRVRYFSPSHVAHRTDGIRCMPGRTAGPGPCPFPPGITRSRSSSTQHQSRAQTPPIWVQGKGKMGTAERKFHLHKPVCPRTPTAAHMGTGRPPLPPGPW